MEYFYGQEARQFAYFRIPKALFKDPRYAVISTDAKLLYGLFLDRLELSLINGWFDEQQRAYIYFKRSEIMEALNIGVNKAAQLMKELEAVDLIERHRQGLGMPTMIFVGRFLPSAPRSPAPVEATVITGDAPQRFENQTNGDLKTTPPEVGKTNPIYMMNNTEDNKTEYSIPLSPLSPNPSPVSPPRAPASPARMDKMDYEKIIRENIEAPAMAAARPQDAEIIEGYVDLLAGICSSHRAWIKIGGENRSRAEVRRQLLRLRRPHIEYVLDSMAATHSNIKNIRSYVLASLYNAPATLAASETQRRRSAATEDRTWMNDYD